MNINFYCRSSKCGKNGLAPIEVSIIIQGKRCYFQTERKERPELFKKAVSSKRDNDTKTFIDLIRGQINKVVNQLLIQGKILTPEVIKQALRGNTNTVYTISKVVKEFLDYQSEKVRSGECSYGVYKKYTYITSRFIKEIGDILITDITPATINIFYTKLRKEYLDSTLSAQMFRLKSVFTYALDNGILTKSPWQVKVIKAKPKIEYLTEKEIYTLIHTDFQNDSLNKIRDIAAFQCGSGISYADLCKVASIGLKQSEKGFYYIEGERCKTGITFTSVLLPFAIDIYNKYDGNLPIISNQKYNAYLKVMQGILGWNKKLHTHLFRKSYATLLLNKGVSVDIVAKAVGHSSSRITASTYAFMQRDTIVDSIGTVVS